jgi:hypothetical protein
MPAADRPGHPGLRFGMRNKVQPRPDARATERAADEWGVLSLDELRACGLSRRQVGLRVQTGWLHPLYRGVYAVGHARVPLHGRFLGAVKSIGKDAVLSHFGAAALWGFVEWDGRCPEVTVLRSGIARRPGIRVHCSAVLERRDVMRHEGIPVTSPPRTLIDLAAVVNEKMVRTAVRRALGLRRISIRQLVAAKRRLGPRRGSATLDRVLMSAAPTRTELEDVVLDLIVDAGFARPDVNKPLLLADRRVIPGFRWPDQRVVVEADGGAWHDNPIARQDDAERQALLEAHGERVVRVGWGEAVAKPAETLARIRSAGVTISRLGAVSSRTMGGRRPRPH